MSIFGDRLRLVPFDDLTTNDFAGILAGEKNDWETLLEWDFTPIRDAFQCMLASRILPGVAVMSGDQCRGYVFHVFRDTRCILGGFYFAPELRQTEWPRLVLERIFRDARFIPLPPAVEGQILFPGPEQALLPYLLKQGFSWVERRFMRLPHPSPTRLDRPLRDLEILPVNYGQIDQLALLLNRSYQDHVDNQVSSLYQSFQGCSHLLTQIILHDGCGPLDPSCALMARLRDELVGAILVSRISRRSYYVSQVFVHPKYQAQGIGRFLMRSVIDAVARKEPGVHLALTVTAENSLAYRWYARIGFQDILPHYSFTRRTRENGGQDPLPARQDALVQ